MKTDSGDARFFIPDKIRVGYQTRSDTYTKQLAYVIYYDQKGVLRKKASWEAWRNDKIAPHDFENVPTEGFVLNRNGGGGGGRWDERQAFIRVYDPRNFEFEISVANLLFILRECDCSRGKGLEGKFVYGWEGTTLVLLPATCEEYKQAAHFTKLQGQRVKPAEMIPGATYTTKQLEDLVYVGRFDYFYVEPVKYANASRWYRGDKNQIREPAKSICVKRHVFWDGKNFVYKDALTSVATLKSDAVSEEYAALVQKYVRSAHGSKVESLFLKEVADKKDAQYAWYGHDDWYYEDEPGVFVECSTELNYHDDKKISCVATDNKHFVKDGMIVKAAYKTYMLPPGAKKERLVMHEHEKFTQIAWREPTTHRLFARMESGSSIRVQYSTFNKDLGG